MTHKNWLSLCILGVLSLSVAACEKNKDESASSESEEAVSSMEGPASEDMTNPEPESIPAESDSVEEGVPASTDDSSENPTAA